MILTILSPLFSLILIIVLGFIITKFNILTVDMQKGLSNFVMKVTLPFMLLVSMQIEFDYQILKNSIYALILGFIFQGLSLLIAYKLFKKFKKIKAEEVGLLSFGTAFCNVGYLGLPILEALYGQEAVIYGTMIVVSYNVLSLTIGIKICLKSNKAKTSFREIFSNPVIAVTIGFILFALNIKIPHTLKYPIELVGNITTPLFLLITGSVVASNKLDKSYFDFSILTVSLFRLLLIPIFIYGVLLLLPLDNLLRMAITMNLSMPTGAFIVVMTREYDLDSYLASKILVTTTLLSSITIPIIALIIN